MNELTSEQRNARLQDARSALLRSLDAIDSALVEAAEHASRHVAEHGGHARGEPFVEGLLVLWTVRRPDLRGADDEESWVAETDSGWSTSCMSRTFATGMLQRQLAYWSTLLEGTDDDG